MNQSTQLPRDEGGRTQRLTRGPRVDPKPEVVFPQLEARPVAHAFLRLSDVTAFFSAMLGWANDRTEARAVRDEAVAAGAPRAEVSHDAVSCAVEGASLAPRRLRLERSTERVIHRKSTVVHTRDVAVPEASTCVAGGGLARTQ